VNDQVAGHDATSVMSLKPGMYSVRVVNHFLGEHKEMISVSEGQTGTIVVNW
jgi:hypothetical protein